MTERYRCEHVLANHGPHSVFISLWDSAVQHEVAPGASFTGRIKSIWHGDNRSHYTIAPADEVHGEFRAEEKT